MPLPEIDNCFRTVSSFTNTVAGEPWSVTMDFTAGEPFVDEGDPRDQLLAVELAKAWRDLFASIIDGFETFADYIHPSVTCTNLTVYDLEAKTAPVIFTPTPQIKGLSTAHAMPPDVALCVSKRTRVRGRRFRGRFYLAGFTEDANSSAGLVFDDSFGTQANNSLRTFGEGDDRPFEMVVISQATVPTGTMEPVTSLTTDLNWDTQRRRGR
uniref:Uncharacterized protein n=1 Tax=uncultured prokaryote TaxID=198431 RepID=A0A0H5Q8P8_9ZZZZ|nr:hypothetical protein [uncultured prokaryote]